MNAHALLRRLAPPPGQGSADEYVAMLGEAFEDQLLEAGQSAPRTDDWNPLFAPEPEEAAL